MSEQDGGPAFPFVEVRSVNKLTGSPLSQVIHEGLSKRDEFAKAAMQTLCMFLVTDLTGPDSFDDGDTETVRAFRHVDQDSFDGIAEFAYRMADAMLKARTSTESPTP